MLIVYANLRASTLVVFIHLIHALFTLDDAILFAELVFLINLTLSRY